LISHNLNWFLGISVAAHMAALLAWQSSTYTPGHTGQTVHLSVITRAGDNHKPPSPPTESPAQAAPDNTARSNQTKAPPTGVTATLAAVQDSAAAHPARMTSQEQAPAVAHPIKVTTATATSTSMASNPVLQQEETDRHLRRSVMELITRELTYPAIARRKGWQGIVKLELHIEADGSITDLQIDETSGYSILDKAALQCLQLASIPDAAQWLQGHAIDIVVPVEYRLLDS
jgi:protein TonB